MLILETILDIVIVGGFLTVFWLWLFRREKLLAFEDKALDWLAEKIAKVVIWFRHLKKGN